MKGSVTLSSMAHVAVLAWGLVSLSGPKPLDVPDVEALPIDIIPIEEVTKTVQGDKKAELTETPSPRPTENEKIVPEATNIGEAEKDTPAERPLDPTPNPAPTERVDAPPPEPAPAEPTPPEEKPKEVVEEPKPEPVPAEEEQQFASLPQSAPVPERRPKPRPPEQVKEKKKDTEDEIAALLNKEKPSSGGAKRSTETASLGTNRPGNAVTLSQSEMDALRAKIQACWSVPAGLADAEDMRVTIKMRLDRSGAIEGSPQIDASGGEPVARQAFAESANRAVLRCAPYELPAEKYETWADVVVNFDPSQMF